MEGLAKMMLLCEKGKFCTLETAYRKVECVPESWDI